MTHTITDDRVVATWAGAGGGEAAVGSAVPDEPIWDEPDAPQSADRRLWALRSVHLGISTLRLIPALLLVSRSRRRDMILADLDRWMTVRRMDTSRRRALRLLMARVPEFRSVVYWRLGVPGRFVAPLYPGVRSLHLYTDPTRVGPGLYIQHGDTTYVKCRSIGRDCWINQGVTIGYTNDHDHPTLGDHVTVNAGAKILGDVRIGDGVRVGANAVVLRDVPSGSVVIPPTARIISP